MRLREGARGGPAGGGAGLRAVHRPQPARAGRVPGGFPARAGAAVPELIADLAGAAVSEGFIHSCLAKAEPLVGDVVELIRTLITASAVAGFDETTLRCGRAGTKKYVQGAFTERYRLFLLGTRSLKSLRDFGILPGFAGVVVSDRYHNYFHARWKHIAGNQACLAHLMRDYQDSAESYPKAIWPVQAQRALRGLIHAWHAAREQGLDARFPRRAGPLVHEFRHAVLAGCSSVPRVPGPKSSTKQRPGRDLLEFCRDRRSDVLLFAEDTSIWPTNNISVMRSPVRVHAARVSRPWRVRRRMCLTGLGFPLGASVEVGAGFQVC